jgi:glutaredoxin
MIVRLFFLACLCAASTVASAGPVEDLFRRLIEQRQAAGQWVPGVALGPRVPEVTKPMILPRNDGLELGREQVAMFVQPGCRSCDAAAKRLAARGWKVELLDLGESATAREAFRLSGATGAPTVLFGKHMLSGYTDALFDRLLKLDFQQRARQQQGEGA